MNKRIYCRPIKLYVCLIFREHDGLFEALLFRFTTGVLLFPITMPFPSDKKRCAFINNKDYAWLHDWLIEKDIAVPTGTALLNNGYSYYEFCFKEEK